MDQASALSTQLRQRASVIREAVSSGSQDERIQIRDYRQFIRQALPMAAAIVSARRYQSPACNLSTHDVATCEGPRLASAPFPFQYARWHSDLIAECEQAFLHNYGLPDLQACMLTNAGMGAVNLALEAVLRQHPGEQIFLFPVGQIYQETEFLCRALIPTRPQISYRPVPQSAVSVERYLAVSTERRAVRVVLADAIENHPDARLFDLIPFLEQAPSPKAPAADYLVLDRTLVGHLWRPQIQRALLRTPWTIIEVESLTKYHQLGLDLVTAGAVYFPIRFIESYGDPITERIGLRALWQLRANLGLAPAEMMAATLPVPSDARQERRLHRHYRNASLLASAVCQDPESIWRANHPSTPEHPDHLLARDTGVPGGLVFLSSRHPNASAELLVAELIRAARRAGLVISERAGFGFNETSLDVWGRRTLRVAAGTEPLATATRLAGLFRTVLQSDSNRCQRA